MNEFYGSRMTITGDVKYVGQGEDPATHPGIVAFARVLKEVYHPERRKREDHYIGGYFPPPWNPNEHPEKTKGWIAFQEAQRKDPKYYGCGALNTDESQ